MSDEFVSKENTQTLSALSAGFPAKAAIGTIVLFHSVKEKASVAPITEADNVVWPALVQASHDDATLDLWIFGEHSYRKTGVKFGTTRNCWSY